MRPTRVHHRALFLLLVAALLGSLLGTAAVGPTRSAAAASSLHRAAAMFDDVPAGAFYADAVAWLADAGITTGTGPTTFSPEDVVTRGQMAAFLERFAQIDGDPADHSFGDVPAGSYYDGAVGYLAQRGITTGTSPSTYSPNDVVTRGQMAAFLWRFSNETPAEGINVFIDVSPTAFYFDAVRWLAEAGITTGTSPITFSPNDGVTRGQMATFLWRMAGEPEVGELGTNRVDADEVVVPEVEDFEPVALDPEGESQLEWTGDEAPEVGSTIAVGVTEETPDGLLAVVTEVDGEMVTAEATSLVEAIPVADVNTTLQFEEEDNGQSAAAAAGSGLSPASFGDFFDDKKAKCQTDDDVFEVDFDVNLDAGVQFEASWGLGDGVQAYVGFNLTLTTNVDFSADAGVSCTVEVGVEGPKLGRLTFFIGGLPVVLTPQISLELEIGGNIGGGIETGWTNVQSITAGIRYDDGDWSVERESNSSSSFDETFTVNAEASAYVEPRVRLDLLVYGAAGPYATIGPFFELAVSNDVPWWRLDGGIRLGLGASFDLVFFKGEIAFPKIELDRQRIADSGTSPLPSPFEYLNALPVRQLESGWFHSCAVLSSERVACWGENSSGQLGDGTTTDRNSAVFVDGGNVFDRIENAEAVTAGLNHSCALLLTGEVTCWGDNSSGQLGDGTFTDSSSPVMVSGIDDAIAIDAGARYTCALRDDLSVWCWGNNTYGTLGNGTFGIETHTNVPGPVSGLSDVLDIAAGQQHACAALVEGTVKCWGTGGYGELGDDNAPLGSAVPVDVFELDDVIQVVAGGSHSCALKNNGNVWCWGRNLHGELGNGTYDQWNRPRKVFTISNVVDLTAGTSHTCAVNTGSFAKCWGQGQFGQLGNDDINSQPAPVNALPPSGPSDFTHISAGGDHTCGGWGEQIAFCWGRNASGQLGTTDFVQRLKMGNAVRNPES